MKSNKEVPDTELLLDTDKPKINGIFDNGFTNIDTDLEDGNGEDPTQTLKENTIHTNIVMEKEPENGKVATIIAGIIAFIIAAVTAFFIFSN